MKIGELAQATGTAVETIRFYEREALLAAPARSSGNFRIYDGTHAERLAFIRHCRSLDMTLDEIRLLLAFKDQPGRSCEEVDALLDAHIGHVAARIKELRSLQKQLQALREQCDAARGSAGCGILQGLSQASRSSRKARSHVGGTHRHRGGG